MAELDNLDVKILTRLQWQKAVPGKRKALPERHVNRGIGLRG